ncbi:hypothetical protein AAFF_G00328950 [Aldrovandia affinis]|uniref:Ig-like domain-containing protein n=1 Tax=Aldrovandia affinis TaxID=143900 RepID=A0AAD7SLU9_9TELE|nr:hypothetical protein AAFF_G00328950 [Aldrovandia affinis]
MTAAERFILIGCLLQGALGREWGIWMPQSIEALSGSCVLIPCRFEIPSKYDKHLRAGVNVIWKKGGHRGTAVFDSRLPESKIRKNEIEGELTGDLLKKNCTTILDNFPLGYSAEYAFRLESQSLNFNFQPDVQIDVQDSPPKPKLSSVKVEVTEGSSVSLNCSAAAPCPTLPPNLTWTPRLSDSVDQLQENQDQTKYVSSVLTFIASHLHHGQKITCTALYKLQQGDSQKISEASLTLSILYMPQISASGSCSRTAAEISCSCESHGNPSPSMEWCVSGLRVTNSTDRVIREEHLGNTGLRSSLTMRHSQGDTPTLLCLSTNTLGSSSLQLLIPSPEQHSILLSTGLLVIGILVGALITGLLCGVTQFSKRKRSRLPSPDNCSDVKKDVSTSSQSELMPSSSSPPPKPDEDIYANHIMVTEKQREGEDHGKMETQTQIQMETQSQAADDFLHYASVKITGRKTNQEPATATNNIYGNVSCDRSRTDCSSNDSLIHPQPAEPCTQASEIQSGRS